MKIREFVTSKRTWTIVAMGALGIIRELFPSETGSIVTALKMLFGGN